MLTYVALHGGGVKMGAVAPVMVVDGIYHNKLRVEQIPGIIEHYASVGAEEVTDHD